jgi:2-polyprenyl-3-methyl-5-hydroxy-6-metoxy-1,4-benzoquinol methylase
MYLKSMPGGRLLDVGCGSGELLERMQNLGWHAEGLDTDAVAIQMARERGLQVRSGELEQHSYSEANFDAVTLNHVIEHVHDPRTLLMECSRLLKPGGRVVVVTPNVDSLEHKRFKAHWRGLEPPRHLQVFSSTSLWRLAQETGFRCFITTTMQSADWMYVASRSLKRYGTYSADKPVSRLEQARGRAMQHLEWAMLKVKPDVGEEIVATLVKP